MTRLEFYALCTELTIYPLIALENEEVTAALKRRASRDEVRQILTEQF